MRPVPDFYHPLLFRFWGQLEMDDVGQTLLFLLIVLCLGASLIAALYEIEQARARWRVRQAERARIARLAPLRRR
jgi:cytochrome c biogenesis protein ResB